MIFDKVYNNLTKHEYFSVASIAVLVFAFNYEAVAGLDVLLLDDQSRFCNALKDQFFNPFFFKFGWAPSILKALNLKLMIYGMEIARGFYVVVFAIPLSFTLYYFNRKSLALGFTPSFISAILINILPFQYHIPKFIDGSYPLPAMLFLFFSLVFAVSYLNFEQSGQLILAAFFWYLASQLCGELGIIIFPALLFLFVFWDSPRKVKIVLVITYVLMLLPRVYQVVFYPRGGAGKAVVLSFDTMLYRFKKVVAWGSIIKIEGDTAIIYAAIAVIAIIAIGFLFFKQEIKPVKRNNVVLIYGFYLLFGFLAMSPFVFVSKFFSTRYFFISYLALWVLITVSAYQIFKRFFKRESLIFGILFMVLLFVGFQRHVNQIKDNGAYNRRNKPICSAIKNIDTILPEGQVIVVDKNNGSGQYFVWSTGYIRYCIRRSDVVGLIGNEYHFYDAFDVNHRGYAYKMEGFDIKKPLYIIRFRRGKVVQPKLFLRWLDRKSRESKWILYKRNSSTAMLSEIYSGTGLVAYKEKIIEMGLDFDDILWGNINTESWRKGF
jgi:hypothetical protein